MSFRPLRAAVTRRGLFYAAAAAAGLVWTWAPRRPAGITPAEATPAADATRGLTTSDGTVLSDATNQPLMW